MNKLVALIVGLVIVGAGYGVYNATKDDGTSSSQASSSTTAATSENNSNTSTKAKYNDACKVISKADLKAAYGVEFRDGKAEAENKTAAGLPAQTCTFVQENDGSVAAMTGAFNFTVKIDNYGSSSAAATEMKTIRSTEKLGDKVYFVSTDAPGVGDEAFFFQSQAEIALKTEEYMYARKGSQVFHFVMVRLDGVDHTQQKSKITDLAKAALN